jgi:site-specific DNA-cytosine methylase
VESDTNSEILETGENRPLHSGQQQNMKIRRLTPTECERLQSFPDGWTEGISDSQRYKCLGNAVTVNVVEHIMEKLLCQTTN